jgi:hypothetical protein
MTNQGVRKFSKIRPSCLLDHAEGRSEPQNSAKEFAFFYLMTYVFVGIVLVLLVVPYALRVYVTQLTPSDIVGILLVDLVLSLFLTPVTIWIVRTTVRARYRKEVL